MPPIEFDRRRAKARDLENDLAPAEIADVINAGCDLPFLLRPLLLSGEAPVRYRPQRIVRGVNFYTVDGSARRLIVAFCNAADALTVPVAYFLQLLRDDLYDVLVLNDRHKLHFDKGIDGFSQSHWQTVVAVKAYIATKHYEEIVTFGASMGGYPALRAGLLMGATRSISVGGVFPWHVGRLMRKQETTKAFDPLCPCFAQRPTETILIASAGVARDLNDAMTVQSMFPECHLIPLDTNQHSVMAYLHRVNLLRLFLACLFEYWRSDNRVELISLINSAACHGHAVEEAKGDRLKKLQEKVSILRAENRNLKGFQSAYTEQQTELEGLYRSTSWRLTKPLRAASRFTPEVWRLDEGSRPSRPTFEALTNAGD